MGGGNPAPLTFCGGAGPGVDDPEGAGEAVYCGVFDPGGGPWNCTGWLPAGLPCPAFGGNTGPPPNELGPPPLWANPPGPLPWLSGTAEPGPLFQPAPESSSADGRPNDGPGGAFRLPNPGGGNF